MEISGVPAVFIFFLLLLIRPLTVFLHEMGHAVTGWIITGKRVNVFIGSYGDKDKSLKINFKNFSFYIFKNPFKWGIGLCEIEENKISVNKQILFVLGGPIASFVVGGISYFIISRTEFWELFFILLMISSAIDFIVNIFPSKKVLYLSDSRIISNDGRNIINLIELKKLPKEYIEGISRFQEKKYSEASVIFDRLLESSKKPAFYRMAIASNINNKSYERAKEVAIEFKENTSMNSDDMTNLGLTFTETGKPAEALEYYDEALKMNPNNKFALNNKGYTLILLEKYEDSILLLNQAISLDKNFSYSYNNRGLAKINLDLYEEGLKDIEDSLQLDSRNSYAYKNIGIYHMKKMNYEKALDLFLKAKALDESTYKIEELITEARSKIV